MAQSLGIIDLIWGGTKINVDAKSSSFSRGGLINTPVTVGRKINSSQMMVAPSVKASFTLDKGVALASFDALSGSDLQVKCDSGQTYIITNAFLSKDLMVKGGAVANVTAEWSGDPAVEAGV